MEKTEFYIVTGIWPHGHNKAEEFFTIALEENNLKNAYQLNQSFSKCEITAFDKDSALALDDLEQYRAFCPDWELWLRNINSQILRFRFVGIAAPKEGAEKRLGEAGYQLDEGIEKETVYTEEAAYPLWGEPIEKGENHQEGWYTQRIPQIIQYPVDFPADIEKKRVSLKVENLLGEDGYIAIVRYMKLDVEEAVL